MLPKHHKYVVTWSNGDKEIVYLPPVTSHSSILQVPNIEGFNESGYVTLNMTHARLVECVGVYTIIVIFGGDSTSLLYRLSEKLTPDAVAYIQKKAGESDLIEAYHKGILNEALQELKIKVFSRY